MRRIAAILLALGMLVVTALPAAAEDHGLMVQRLFERARLHVAYRLLWTDG